MSRGARQTEGDAGQPSTHFLVMELVEMDDYVRGMGKKFSWRDVLKTVDDESTRPKISTELGERSGSHAR